jgi:hypothetical protein
MSAEGSWKLQARKSERLSFSRRKLNQSGHSQRNHHSMADNNLTQQFNDWKSALSRAEQLK